MPDWQRKRGEVEGIWCRATCFFVQISGVEREFLGFHAGCTVTDGDGWNPSEKGMEGSVAQIQRLKKAIYLNSDLCCHYYRCQSERLICYFNGAIYQTVNEYFKITFTFKFYTATYCFNLINKNINWSSLFWS